MSTTAAYHMASSSQSVPRKRPATVPDSSLPSGPGGTLSRAGSVSTEGSRRRVLPAARAPVQGGARAAAFYRSPSAETAAAVSPGPRHFSNGFPTVVKIAAPWGCIGGGAGSV
ncbi:hypothetical protein DIPPA_35726 [Diplonema papillatum]|nr:hypothetical protein DIPPA_35716 [Diplonema papillatum]KAJ9449785.1 hypothetical protein DIPPA_35726 [Diplonema papillatum]